jgi:type VII secretion integral membrane protein EccD
VAAASILLGLVNVARAEPPWIVPGLVCVGLAFVLALVGMTLARAMGDAVAGATIGSSGLPYAFAGGALLAAPDTISITHFGAPQLLAGSAALVVFGVSGYVAIAAVSRLFAAAVTAGVFGVIGGLLGYTSVSGAGTAAVLLTVGIGLMPGYPLLSIRIGRLPLPTLPQRAEELMRDEPPPERPAVFAAVARSDEVLTGILLGVAVVSMVSSVVLVVNGARSAIVLTAVASGALLLRARLFPTPRQRVSLLASGLGGLVVLVVAASVRMDSTLAQMLLLTGVVVVGAAVLIAGLVYSRRPPSPYLGRFADLADVLLIVLLIPITCVLVGFYDYMRDLFASIG